MQGHTLFAREQYFKFKESPLKIQGYYLIFRRRERPTPRQVNPRDRDQLENPT